MTNMVVRSVCPDDLPALTTLWLDASILQRQIDPRFRLRTNAVEHWSEAVTDWLSNPDFALYTAEFDNDLLGLVIGHIQSNAPGLLPESTGAVLELLVDAHTIVRGVGQGLLSPLMDWFRAHGIEAVTITCPRRHAISQAFWRAQGASEYLDILWMKL